MAKVQPVPPTSWKKVGVVADQFINKFYPELLLSMGEFPVIDFLEFKLSKLKFTWEIVELTYGLEAEVDFEEKVLRISERTYEALHNGDRRARFTIMHEVGHIVLHSNHFEKIIRKEKPNIIMHRKNIPPYKDPECQANTFSACALMPAIHVFSLLDQGKAAFDIQTIFNVSTDAAINRVSSIGSYK